MNHVSKSSDDPPGVSEGCPASPFSTFFQDVMFGEDEFSNISELKFG